jgi:hypothetical protein
VESVSDPMQDTLGLHRPLEGLSASSLATPETGCRIKQTRFGVFPCACSPVMVYSMDFDRNGEDIVRGFQ